MKEQIVSRLAPDYPWSELLHTYTEVDSTNTLAKALAAEGFPHGTAVIASRQTGGRGRMGRQFHSPGEAGVYLSLILRPECAPSQLMHLTCAVAVAVCQAIEDCTGVQLGIKWINDLIWNRRKIAGILTELSLDAGTGKIAYAVVGIGVNCRQQEGDFPDELQTVAGSLAMATGKDVSPHAVTAAILNRLWQMDGLLQKEKSSLMDAYRKRCITVGQPVSVHHGSEAFPADAVGIDDNGALLVRTADGNVIPVNSGEASIRSRNGYV